MTNLLRLLFYFPLWWYGDRARWFLRLFRNLIFFLDRKLAVSLMFRLWLTPVFGDHNIVGRVIAVIFRTFRIIFGLLTIIFTEISIFLSLVLWLILPLFLLTGYGLYALGFLIMVFVYYWQKQRDLPTRKIQSEADLRSDPEEFLKPSLLKSLVESTDNRDWLVRILERRVPKKIILKLGFTTSKEFLDSAGVKLESLKSLPKETVLKESFELALKLKSKSIASPHILLAMMARMNFKYGECLEILRWSNLYYDRTHLPPFWSEKYVSAGLGGFNRSWTGRVTPNLDRYARDLTQEAQEGLLPTLIGKQKSLEQSLRILERSSKSNVLLVGSPGCGKTTLVYGMAQEIVKGTQSLGLQDKRLVMLELGRLQAGTKSTGEIHARIDDLMDDISGSKNIILFIDEIHNAVAAGGTVETSLIFSAFEPKIGSGAFQTIGATTWDNYRKYIEPNEAFSRLFERIEIPEANFEETLEILEYVCGQIESENKIVVSLDALKACIELSVRYVYDRVLPDKAIDLLEEAATYVRNQKRLPALVLRKDIENLIFEKTKIPVSLATSQSAESESLLNLEKKIHERLINQTEAVTAVANALRRARTGLRDERRPITSLLFVGPTGVGKTETAKALAATFYGDEARMIRFDMSEFQTDASVETIISKLTDAVRHYPFSLLLFDEVEKASRRILDIFLQVIDDGRLTDALGHTVSFANCLIVFTSNAGTSFIFDNLRQGRAIESFRNELFKKLEEEFRIEFLNRFDGIIIYKPLSGEHIEMIARLKLEKISSDMNKQGYKISFTPEVVEQIAREGYDVALGARPMRRLIQDKIESSLAKKILSGEIKKEELYVVQASILSSQ